MILLVDPPSDNLITGGYIYNRYLEKHLSSKNHLKLVQSVPQKLVENVFQALKDYPAQVIILDSLYITYSREWLKLKELFIQYNHSIKIAFLVHLLPSQNPAFLKTEQQLAMDCEKNDLPKADYFIAPSKSMAESLMALGILSHKIGICPAGIDTCNRASQTTYRQIRQDDEPKKIHILTVSNWMRRKNHIQLLKTLENLAHFNWDWTIVGDTDVEPEFFLEFNELFHQSKVKDRIFIAGQIAHHKMSQYYQTANLFALPSLYENYPLSLIESAANGLPMIANDVGGNNEIIKHQKNGLLCKNVTDWENHLAMFFDSSLLQKYLTAQSIKMSMQIPSWDKVAKKFLYELKSCV